MAAAHRLGRDRQRLIVELGILFDAREVAVEIGAGAERQAVGHSGKALVPAIISGEQHVALGKTVGLHDFGQAAAQDGVVDPVGGGELRGRDRVKPGEKGFRFAHPASPRGGAEIFDAVVIIAHAQRGGVSGAALQQPAIMLRHQRLEIVLRRGGGRGGPGEGGGDQGGGQEAAHSFLQSVGS
jgi:hypothetical protein